MELKRLTPEILATKKDEWVRFAQDLDMPSSSYEGDIGWALGNLSYDQPNGGSLAYGIFDVKDELVALVDIIHTRRAGPDLGWIKMLDIKLSPKFAPSELDNPEKILTVVSIYTQAFIGTMKLTDQHIARVVKLFGRDKELLNVLKALKTQLGTLAAEKFAVEMNGRWLVISTINQE